MSFIDDGGIMPLTAGPDSEPRKGRYAVKRPIIPIVTITTGGGQISPAEITSVSTTPRNAQLNVSATDERARIVLGRVRVGAVIPFAMVWAVYQLVIVCLWGRTNAAGYDAIESFSMDNKPLPQNCTVTHYLGTQTTPDATLVSAFASRGVTYTAPLTGVCYSVVTLNLYDNNSQIVNLGEFHAIIRGLKCYDPRAGGQTYATPSTWTYSNNPALVAATLITESDIGIGCTPDAAFWTSVTTAANYADDTLTGGGATKRFALNMALQEYATAESHIKSIGAYGGFWPIPEGGSFRFIVDKTETAGATITRADMIEDTFSATGIDSRQRPNRVLIRYAKEETGADWTTALAPIGADVPAIPSGEERRVSVIDMPGIVSYDQALRAAKLIQNHSYLEDVQMSFQLTQKAITLFVGDVRPITFGIFTAKVMRCVSVTLNKLGFWDTTWKEYDAAAYNNTFTAEPSSLDSNLPDPFAVPAAITGLTLAELAATNESTPSPLSRIKATWTASASLYVARYIVTVTDDALPPVTLHEATITGTEFLSPLLPSPGKYAVSVQPVSFTEVKGTALTASIALQLSSVIYETMFSQALVSTGWEIETIYGFGAGDITQTGLLFETTGSYPGTYYARAPAAGYPPDDLLSPKFDLGSLMTVALFLDAIKSAADLNRDRWYLMLETFGENGASLASIPFDGSAIITARYFRLIISSRDVDDTPGLRYAWEVDLTGGVFVATSPVTSEIVAATTSASAVVTVTMANRYLKLLHVGPAVNSTTFSNPNASNTFISEYAPNTFDLDARNAAGTREAKSTTTLITGVRGQKALTNWALTKNGATASSSGDFSASYPAGSAFNGDRTGVTFGATTGGWHSSTNSGTRTLTTTFTAAKSIDTVNVTSLQDSYATGIIPGYDKTGTSYVLQDFLLEKKVSGTWSTVQTITANTLIFRQFTGLGLTNVTDMRLTVTATPDGYARVVEFECIGPA